MDVGTEPFSGAPSSESRVKPLRISGVREAGGGGPGPISWEHRAKLANSPEACLAGGPGYTPPPITRSPETRGRGRAMQH